MSNQDYEPKKGDMVKVRGPFSIGSGNDYESYHSGQHITGEYQSRTVVRSTGYITIHLTIDGKKVDVNFRGNWPDIDKVKAKGGSRRSTRRRRPRRKVRSTRR